MIVFCLPFFYSFVFCLKMAHLEITGKLEEIFASLPLNHLGYFFSVRKHRKSDPVSSSFCPFLYIFSSVFCYSPFSEKQSCFFLILSILKKFLFHSFSGAIYFFRNYSAIFSVIRILYFKTTRLKLEFVENCIVTVICK